LAEDDVEPECIEGRCLIPALDAQEQRILEIRHRLISLKDLVDPGTILRLYDADLEDLELLAAMEAELKRYAQQKEPPHGGSED
jgi:hypothetical protein